MTTAIRGINTKVEIQATLGTGKTITAITKASPGVVTSTAHGFVDGDVVVLTGMEGMYQLNNVAVRVANKTNDTFELEGINTTNYGTFTAGTATNVATWNTFASLQTLSLPNAAPNELDQTTIHDQALQTTYGLAGAPSGTISGLFAPTETAVANLRTATLNTQNRVFRITFETGQKAIFNATPAAGQGFELPVNGIATAQYQITVRGFVNFYAS